MATRIHDNLLKGLLFVILFTFLLLHSFLGYSQSATSYRGFVAAFGTRNAAVASDIAPIHGSKVTQSGGQVGFVYGNSVVRSTIGLLGYYSSVGKSTGTTDLYTSNVSVNFYPLSLLSDRNFLIEPYFTGGLDYDRYKFYGFYLQQEPGQLNYSQAEAPYLGKIKQVNATGGLGVQVKLRDQFDFIHIFSELRYGRNLSSKTSDRAFAETALNNARQIVIGVSFGARR